MLGRWWESHSFQVLSSLKSKTPHSIIFVASHDFKTVSFVASLGDSLVGLSANQGRTESFLDYRPTGQELNPELSSTRGGSRHRSGSFAILSFAVRARQASYQASRLVCVYYDLNV